MSMGFNLLQSSPTNAGFNLDFGDMKMHFNMALNELSNVSTNFEQYMDACNRFFALCDCIEANEGMLDPVVRDFVNKNGDLSAALGINLAMEDDSQDAQKENGGKVTNEKKSILRRMWEGIKKFIRWILDKIGSFFHWLGNLFAGTKKKMEWVLHDGINVTEEFTQLPKEQQDAIVKEGLSASFHKKAEATEAFEMGSIYPNQKTADKFDEQNYEVHPTNSASLIFCHFDQLGEFLDAYSNIADKFSSSVDLLCAAIHDIRSVETLNATKDRSLSAIKELVDFVNNTSPQILPKVQLKDDGTIAFQVPKAIRCDSLDHTNIFTVRTNGFIKFAETLDHMGSADSYVGGVRKGLLSLQGAIGQLDFNIEEGVNISQTADYIDAAKKLRVVIKSHASFAAGICATYGKFCKSVFESTAKSYAELRRIEKAILEAKDEHRKAHGLD